MWDTASVKAVIPENVIVYIKLGNIFMFPADMYLQSMFPF